MKSISLLLLPMFIAIATVAQTNTDWKQLQLKGKVKSLKAQETYRYKPSGTWTEWAKTYGRLYLFAPTGRRTEYQEYGLDGKLSYKIMYVHNAKDKKMELSFSDKEGKPTIKKTHVLNDKGQLLEEIEFTREGNPDRRYVHAYDEKGNKTSMTGYKADGTMSSKTTWVYDSKGNATDYKVETPGYASSSRKFVYDEKGNIKEEIWYNGKGEIDFRFIRTYDGNGNKTEEIKYKGTNSTLLDMVRWKYEYDKTGNWTKRTETTSDGIDFHIEERTISYY